MYVYEVLQSFIYFLHDRSLVFSSIVCFLLFLSFRNLSRSKYQHVPTTTHINISKNVITIQACHGSKTSINPYVCVGLPWLPAIKAIIGRRRTRVTFLLSRLNLHKCV